jgi:hypothetical protein
MKAFFNWTALAGLSIVLAGCLSTTTNPALLAAATPGSDTPPTISGEVLDSCFNSSKYSNLIRRDPVGTYSPPITFEVMKSIERMSDKTERFASRIRVYSLRYTVRGFLGEATNTHVCLTDLYNGNITFLSDFVLLANTTASQVDYDGAIADAYYTLSGKSRWRLW